RSGIEALEAHLEEVGVPGGTAYNPGWQEALNLENLLVVARLVVASATERTESRGSHFRADHPARNDHDWLARVTTRLAEGQVVVGTEPVALGRLHPRELEVAG
ncbi:MAG TPA: hypothetical protein VE152_00665, partial [Acidimicrobiales bacterium]|nr:hypothetical protein [Acidimicrobiales bacterium]